MKFQNITVYDYESYFLFVIFPNAGSYNLLQTNITFIQMAPFGITTLKAQNILLFNFYSLITLHLLFNWNVSSCSNHTSLWKLVFFVIMYGRLIGDELFHNKKISERNLKQIKVVTSIVLVGLAIVMILLLSENGKDFDHGECFLNRIEYAVEVALVGVIVVKDFFGMGKREVRI